MISIIVPTYNRASLIPRLLKSIQNQKFKNWELIIMDDGSIDDTPIVVKPFLTDQRIKYFKKKNTGVSHTRNEGVHRASYKWIAFFDSDDEAKESWLSSMVSLLKKKQIGAVFCGTQWHNTKDPEVAVVLPGPHPFFPEVTARFNAGSYVLLKEAFQKIGGFDPAIRAGEQMELSLRLIPYLLNNGYSFENVMLPLVKVHHHEGIRARSNYNDRYLSSTGTLKKHEAIFKKNKEMYYDYISVAGVSAIRTNRIKEGKKLLLKAVTINPYKGISYLRFFISHFPWVRSKIWNKKK